MSLLENYVKKSPPFHPFDVICVDDVFMITDITKGEKYTVVGAMQGFFILKNDKGSLGKYYRDRFKLVEDEETIEG